MSDCMGMQDRASSRQESQYQVTHTVASFSVSVIFKDSVWA